MFVAAVMRELVQLGILAYVVPEAKRYIFSSDVTAGDISFRVVGHCRCYSHRLRHHPSCHFLHHTSLADYLSENSSFMMKAPIITATGNAVAYYLLLLLF